MSLRKKNNRSNVMSDETQVVYTFCTRSSAMGFAGYLPPHYYLPHVLDDEAMQALLEDHLRKLAQCDLDEGSGNTLDDLFFSVGRAALLDADRQHVRHRRHLYELDLRHQADGFNARAQRDRREAERAAMERENDRLCALQQGLNQEDAHEN